MTRNQEGVKDHKSKDCNTDCKILPKDAKLYIKIHMIKNKNKDKENIL